VSADRARTGYAQPAGVSFTLAFPGVGMEALEGREVEGSEFTRAIQDTGIALLWSCVGAHVEHKRFEKSRHS